MIFFFQNHFRREAIQFKTIVDLISNQYIFIENLIRKMHQLTSIFVDGNVSRGLFTLIFASFLTV